MQDLAFPAACAHMLSSRMVRLAQLLPKVDSLYNMCCVLLACRERKKQKYTSLQGAVDELNLRLEQLSVMEATNQDLNNRNEELERVVEEQKEAIASIQTTVTKQQAHIEVQAAQIKVQQHKIHQQDQQLTELKRQISNANTEADTNNHIGDELALAVRAVLSGVPAKEANHMQHTLSQLPDSVLQQIRTCCREVCMHLKKTQVKEQPHAIQVPCC